MLESSLPYMHWLPSKRKRAIKMKEPTPKQTALDALKQEYRMLSDLVDTGNYDTLIDIKNKTADRISSMEASFESEAERCKREGRY